MYFLGVDIGTTRMKAALVDMNDNTVDLVGIPVKVQFPFDGAREINMNDIWITFCNLTRQLKERNPIIWNEVAGVGVTGQGDGLWPVDKSGQPVRNSILWNDTRTKNLKIKDREFIDEFCVKHSANVVYAGSAHILLRWLKENEADSYSKISSVLHCKDWINFKLTGELVTDFSDASTALLDVKQKKYVREIFDIMDISDSYNVFPNPVASTTIIGTINETASLECGINVGIPVIAGAIDTASVALGADVKEVGEVCTIVGTTLCNEMVLEYNQVDFKKGLIVCHIVNEKYLSLMATLSGASTIDWVKNLLFPDLSFRELENELEKVPIGSRGILYHPYLYGERAPFRNPFACGGYYGLSATNNKHDMARGAYEGLVLSLYDCYQSLPQIYDSISVSGGGSASVLLCQMIADCLGKEVIRPSVGELGICGIVAALKSGLGVVNGFSKAKSRNDKLFDPNLGNHGKYLKLYEIFKELQIGMSDYWQKRTDF